MMMGSFECGRGLPTLILVLLRVLKYIDGCIFLFHFFLDGVLSAARTDVASLTSVSGDTSSCHFSSLSSIVLSVSIVSDFFLLSLAFFSPLLVEFLSFLWQPFFELSWDFSFQLLPSSFSLLLWLFSCLLWVQLWWCLVSLLLLVFPLCLLPTEYFVFPQEFHSQAPLSSTPLHFQTD